MKRFDQKGKVAVVLALWLACGILGMFLLGRSFAQVAVTNPKAVYASPTPTVYITPVFVLPYNTPVPTATPTGSPTFTPTPTFTPWVPLVAAVAVGSVTPTPVNSPVPNQFTDLFVDGGSNTGTAMVHFKLTRNNVVIMDEGVAPSGGNLNSRTFYDTNGNATWGYIPFVTSGGAGSFNYRLFTHGAGTPVPSR